MSRYFFSCIILFSLLNIKLFAAAPTDIILSSNTISENLPDNSLVGVLSTIDPDGDLVFTYSLVAGVGDDDNTSFVIVDDQLLSNETFDYETKDTYSVRIQTSDGVDTYEESFTIYIDNVNEAPTDISLSSDAVAENLPVSSLVGTFSTADPDGDVSFTYSLVSGTGSTDNASFSISGNSLLTNAIFNFETKSSYSIRVQSSDGEFTVQKVFTISITDENEAPTDIILSSDQVPENQPINTVVGTLSSIDPDGDVTFNYALVGGPGSSDNNLFNILGNQLRTSSVFDSDSKPTCNIRIRTTDGGGLTYDEQFVITVTNVNEPPVLSGIETTPLLYTEDDPATIITSTIVVSDPENGNLTSAEVMISGGLNATEDRLSLISTIFTVNVDNANGRLTISGDGTLSQYQNALRLIRYVNLNERNPSVTNRTIQFVVNDGTYNSTPVYRTIQITAVNDAPDVTDDTYGGVLEGGTLAVSASNGVLNNDEDLDGPVAMTAHLQDDVQFGSLIFNSNGSFTYNHGGTNDLVDGFTYYASDGTDNSALATVTITMIGANDPPELSAIESTVLTYQEGEPPRQITATILVDDEDNITLQSAVIRIDNNFMSAEDLLTYTSNPSLTINYIPATGIINVSGEASLLIYQNFLRSIRYVNTNDLNPSTLIRRVTFTVNDGTNNSVAVYRYIQVTPQNDPPIATNATIIGSDFYVGQLLTADYTFTDPDGDLEGNTSFRWYRADDNQHTGRTLINTSQKDTLTPVFEHGGKWIQFVVRPRDINGVEGVYDTSEYRYINAAPVLNNFGIVGVFAVDETIEADYTYYDAESDPEGTHTFQWYRSTTGSWLNKQAIPGASNEQYAIIANDTNYYIGLEAVAHATSGSSPGQVQQSEWYRVSTLPSAVLSGDIEICEGSTGLLMVTLTGSNAPWTFHYALEGTSDINEVTTSNSSYELEVSEEGTYLLVDVSDTKFDFGFVTGSGTVAYYPQPTAELTVDELSICDNDVGVYTIPVQLTGTAPWNLSYYIVGETDSSYISNIETETADITFTVSDTGTYNLLHVWDANCMSEGTGATDVILRENPKATITGDATVCPGDTTQLTIDLSGDGPWTFYYTLDNGDENGVEVDQSVPSFEYAMDVTEAGVYRLTRVTNATEEGCAYGTVTIENYNQPSATVTGDITICEGSSADISVTLEGTSPWTLSYQHNIDDPVEITSITQNPYLLKVSKGGSYRVVELTDGNNCAGNSTGIAELTVDPAPEVSIIDLYTLYTVNTLKEPFSVEPPGGNFNLSDPNTVITLNDTLFFLPAFAGVENSPHKVIYSYQDPGTGCFGRDTVIVNVIDEGGAIAVEGETEERPERYCFNQDTLILNGFNAELSEGNFTVNFAQEDALINFKEENENGQLIDKAYLIPSKIQYGTLQSGIRTVTYSFELSSGPSVVKRDFNFEKITADFTWDNECYSPETKVKLTDLSTGGSELDSLKWLITFPDHIMKKDTAIWDITLYDLDTYHIEHTVVSQYGCSDTARNDLVLKPTYPIHDAPYFEDFADGESDWEIKVLDPDNRVNSWTFGTPAGNHIIDPYERAWFTEIEYDSAKENSYVISPCFDFSNTKRPMIKMDIWQDFVPNRDGAKIQYKMANDPSWFTLGTTNEGINWFNSSTIQGIPGGQGTGWTEANPENDWQEAKHKMDDIKKDQGLVRFRIAYGAPINEGIERDGFAFDNIWIGERSKKVLVEHFTNMGVDTTIREVNKQFNKKINTMSNDVIDLQYHMNRPGADAFYDLNHSAPDSRDLYYSLPRVPYAIIDGGGGLPNNPKFLIDYSSEDLEESDLDVAVLEDNKFDIDINPNEGEDYVDIDIKVTSLENIGQRYITVHTVIIENRIKDVTSDYGETEFESVVRAMLPDAIGTSYSSIDWMAGTFEEISLSYDYDDIFNIDEVRIVVFVQDDVTHEVYQAEMVPANPAVGINENFDENRNAFLLYPNPASQHTTIEFNEPVDQNTQMQVIDHSGRLVRIIELNGGDQIHLMYVDEYDPGIYILRLVADNEILGVRKLLILGNNQ